MQLSGAIAPVWGQGRSGTAVLQRYLWVLGVCATFTTAGCPAVAMTSADVLADGKQCYLDWESKKKKKPEDLLPCVEAIAKRLSNSFPDMPATEAKASGCALVALYHVAQQTVLASRYRHLCSNDALAELKPGWQKWVREHQENLGVLVKAGEVAEALVQIRGIAENTPWVLTYTEAQSGTPRPMMYRHLLGAGDGDWRVHHEKTNIVGDSESASAEVGWRWNTAVLAVRGHQCDQKPDSLAFDCKPNPVPKPTEPPPADETPPPAPDPGAAGSSKPASPGAGPAEQKAERKPGDKSAEDTNKKAPETSAAKPGEKPSEKPAGDSGAKPGDKKKAPVPPPRDTTPLQEEPPPQPPIAHAVIAAAAGAFVGAVVGGWLVAEGQEQVRQMDQDTTADGGANFNQQSRDLLNTRLAGGGLIGFAVPLAAGVVGNQLGLHVGKRKWTAVGVGGGALAIGGATAVAFWLRAREQFNAPQPAYPWRDQALAQTGTVIASAGLGLIATGLLLASPSPDSNEFRPNLGTVGARSLPSLSFAPACAPPCAGLAVTGFF